MNDVSRRALLGMGGGAAAAALLASAGCGTSLRTGVTGDIVTSTAPRPKPFAVPLPIPKVKEPTRRDATTDYYEITQKVADAAILPGLTTSVFGYDGTFPGPTIVSRRGRRTVVRHRNELPVPVAVHLHGGHTPTSSDGYPVDLVYPVGTDPRTWAEQAAPDRAGGGHDANGEHGGHSEHGGHGGNGGHHAGGDISRGHRDYVFPMDQRAATLWYHDHRMDFTGPQVYRGLAGFHLVHDDEEDALPLPKQERDIPLMIADRSFTADGAFSYPSLDQHLRTTPGVREEYGEGVLGDVILVNGAPWPELEVSAVRYRFRILNASNARRYRLALEPTPRSGPSFVQVGSDGGLLERPARHEELVVAAAERFDVVIDFSAYPVGSTVTLVNELGESEETRRVMRFRITRRAKDDSTVPDRLSRIERLDPKAAVRRRTWDFSRATIPQLQRKGWAINAKPFDPDRMDAAPRLGEVEIWRFTSDLHHPVHVHLDPFQVVTRKGARPGPYDRGWKDTVDVRPGEYVDVAVRFTKYTGKYLLHCHNLEHEDMMMMAAFATR